MAELEVKINNEELANALNKAIADSVLNPHIKKIVDDIIKQATNYMSRPVEDAIKGQVRTLVDKILKEEYEPMIKETIRQHMTQARLDEIVKKFLDNIRYSNY